MIVLRVFLAIPIVLLGQFFPFIKNRIHFERMNLLNQCSISFSKSKQLADYLFHVSSEGELEQVRPIIESFLKNFKKIEIIYTSESVQKKCEALYLEYPKQIRILRMPILSFLPFNILYFQSIWFWITSSKIIMCRYDFFPELLFLKFFQKKLILVSGATKKINWYKKNAYQFFDYIIAANPKEQINFKGLIHHDKMIDWFDFRILRIFSRLDNRKNLYNQNENLKMMIKEISKIPDHQKIILGSFWLSDMGILNNSKLKLEIKSGSRKVFLAPHKLNQQFINDIKSSLVEIFGEENIALINNNDPMILKPINIITIPGILCELYSEFQLSYVGGGYEKSIHSVLEPFLMGSKVIIGPKIHRSTEYDFIKELAQNEIVVLKNQESFYNEFVPLITSDRDLNLRQNIRNDLQDRFELIINRI
jgi:3-deoxy-D-manno-octulosonic-acid transferase